VHSSEVIIAGGGVAGLSIALALRSRGAGVVILERGTPGREASSAAAGMLAAADPETPSALRPLALKSARLYSGWVEGLEAVSRSKVDFRRTGSIVIGEQHPPEEYLKLSPEELRRVESGLNPRGHDAFFVADNSIDPELLMLALVKAAKMAGVEVRTGITVQSVRQSASQVEVSTDQGLFTAKTAVNCMGAWSGAPVKPRKGQMLYVQASPSVSLEHVVRTPGAYLVPRSSGKILIGTTVEDVGFDKSVNADTIRTMHQAAARYVPALASARVIDSWAGLRPGSPDDLPLIGPTNERNVFLASGLFRNGILLAPAVAEVVAAMVMGEAIDSDMAPFAPSRFASAKLTRQ